MPLLALFLVCVLILPSPWGLVVAVGYMLGRRRYFPYRLRRRPGLLGLLILIALAR